MYRPGEFLRYFILFVPIFLVLSFGLSPFWIVLGFPLRGYRPGRMGA